MPDALNQSRRYQVLRMAVKFECVNVSSKDPERLARFYETIGVQCLFKIELRRLAASQC